MTHDIPNRPIVNSHAHVVGAVKMPKVVRARPRKAESLKAPTFTDPVAAIREIRSMKIAPRYPADYPPVDVVAMIRVAITARTRRRDVDLGVRTLAVDVEVDALGTGGGRRLQRGPAARAADGMVGLMTDAHK